MKKQLLFVVSIVLTATLYAQNIPSYVPTNGLVGWWPFNGNANDESGNGNNGVETNINYSQDRNLTNSKSLQLNGNSYVTISNTSTFQGINNQLTICGWFKPTSFFSKNQLYSVICKANNFSPLQFSIQAFPTGVNFLNNGVAYQYLKTINVNTWYFFAITQNQKSVTFYINDSNFTQPNPGTYNYTYSTNNNIEIGRDLYGATEYSTGSTDDIAIYNRALTQQEITSLYTGVPLCNTPNASITPQSSTSFCQGGNVVLNATTGANYTYQWYNNGQIINNATLSSYTTSTNGNYTVTITDGACNASSLPTSVTVNPLPIAKITPQGKIPFCQGSSVDLIASGGTSYLWNNGSTSTTVIANKSDAYYVNVYNSFGCKSIAWLDVMVYPSPTATITPKTTTNIKENESVVLAATKGTGYSYEWYKDGIVIPNAIDSNYTAFTPGNYTVKISTSQSCYATSEVVIVKRLNTLPNYLPSNGLVGWWPFNGNANDESGNGNHGTVNGAFLTSDRNGKTNSAYDFSPLKSTITTNLKAPKGKHARTISLWFNQYSANNSNDQWVMMRYGNDEQFKVFSISVWPQESIGVDIGASYVLYKSYQYQKYQHLVVSYDSINGSNLLAAKVFLNGNLLHEIVTHTAYFEINTGDSHPLQFGPGISSIQSLQTFNGSLDDIAIYNRALTETEIQALYSGIPITQNLPSYLPKDGMIGWWPFNGNANDESGNGNHGTVNGATLTTDRSGKLNSAYSFDGISNLIQCSKTGPTGNPTLTISFWIKSSQKTYGHLIGYGNNGLSGQDLRIFINGNCSSSIAFDTYGNQKAKSNTLGDTWENYSISYDGKIGDNTTIAKFYKNGVLMSSECFNMNISKTNISQLIPITFGRYHGTVQTGFYNGLLDDIAIYNRTLTQEEITALFLGETCTTPIATITPQSATSFCSGGSVNINAATNANYTYQWLNNGAAISAATTATYKATTSGKYSVIVKNNSGCIDTSSVVTVNVSATPSLPILTGPATLCYNSKAIFKASIAGGTWGVANDYLLISSPQGLFRNNKMPPSNLYKTGVTYTLKSKDKLCSVTAQKSVWIRNVAATSVTLTASKQTLKVGEEVAATATTKITGNALFWMSASTSFVSVTGVSPYIALIKGLRPATGANITFSVDDAAKGCRNAAFLPFTVTAAASLVDNESNTTTYTTDLNVYPNPSNGMVTIENIGEAKTISLIDVTGRVLKTTAVNADRMRLDYSTITKGNYFISIQGENLKEIKSIVIE